MTRLDYVDYIRRQLASKSASLYPNDPHRQILYQLGYLQAQLAEAMYNDSHVAQVFKRTIDDDLGK